ncbi:hypothetical protein NQ318_022543 [Aromia moschata]|uniref:DNA-directed DNA polymerase n=1 Tax=Aromia moschata TaxID=1265417 RepID=A0AAV8XLP2_9CUCU|nr:hypothetical protein NQ318_022543 [Aromia moschata]
MYLDATNLYVAAMKESLPTGGFRWMEPHEMETFDCTAFEDTSPKGFVLEVDMDYPAALHSHHNDLPFLAESIIPPTRKIPKLIPNLYNKKKYIIHYRNLQQCLKYGIKLKKIHRILEFSQSKWLGSYVALNTNLRNNSRNEFEKDLYKLLVNSIFGKTFENVDKRQNIKLCSCWVVYDKPLYVGFTILDISKTIIYNFLYGYIKPMYDNGATVLYTDTDSFILELFTDNPYQDIKNNIQFFDTSNYSIYNIHNIPKTKSVVGKMNQ